MPPLRIASSVRGPRSGFALLITITLLAFLVLLLVSLASLTRVETQVAGNNQRVSQARANAIAALNIALGQLQRYAGPDQRVTARADLGTTATVGAGMWTGVWGNGNPSTSPSSSPQLLTWLVSGNEQATFTADTTDTTGNTFGKVTAGTNVTYAPASVIDALAVSSSATSTDIKVKNLPAVLLVGPRTVGTTGTVLPNFVVVPKVDIQVPASTIPGLSGSTSTTIGHYAYWVGDEGVKARMNLVDSYAPHAATADASSPQWTSYAPTVEEQRNRHLVAQRSGIERVSKAAPGSAASAVGTGAYDVTNGSSASSAQFRRDLSKIADGNAFSLMPNYSAQFGADFTRYRYHDLTPVSRGVLADTLRGGLKKDLTTYFNSGDAAVPAGYKGSDLIVPTSFITPVAPTGTSGHPTFGLLKSFYDLRATATGVAASVNVRPHVAGAVQGVYPVITQASVLLSASFFLNSADGRWYPRIHIWPLAGLWNPYNAKLNSTDYTVEFYFDAQALVWRNGTQVGSLNLNSLAASGSPQLKFRINARSFESGEAIMCSADTYGPYSTNAASPSLLAPRYNRLNSYYVDLPTPLATAPVTTDDIRVSAGGTTAPATGTIKLGVTLRLAASNDKLNAVPQGSFLCQAGTGTPDTYPMQDTTSAPPAVLNGVHVTGKILPAIAQGIMAVRGFFDLDSPHGFVANHNHRAVDRAPSPVDGGSGSFSKRSAIWISHETAVGWPYISTSPFPAGDPFFVSRVAGGWIYLVESWNPYNAAPLAPMFDVPRSDFPFASLGLFQHVMFSDHYWHPSYVFGNSRVDPRMKSADTGGAYIDGNNTDGNFTDWSYVLNRAMWDRFFLSAAPTGLTAANLADPTFHLPNARLSFFPNRDAVVKADLVYSAGDAPGSFRKAAAVLMEEGAFNINSTSVDAWKAVLASFNGVVPENADATTLSGGYTHPYGRFTKFPDRAPLPGGTPADFAMPNNAAPNEQSGWAGNRFLNDTEIDSLAQAIVNEIRTRTNGAPLLSLADFINRQLLAGSVTTSLKGTLQAAIDATTINQAYASPVASNADSSITGVVSTRQANMPIATGIPGFLTQADLLQSLGPVLSARSDTFVIRTYGDAVNPVTTELEGRAWCEAVVQRVPDYVNASVDAAYIEPSALTDSINRTMGRRFRVVSFRWLSPEDI
ncbi:MAG TPA: hypothetical protein VK985_07720 [Rariglobus sp.]|nr:hypothetical protein [Rariglobus sp.]